MRSGPVLQPASDTAALRRRRAPLPIWGVGTVVLCAAVGLGLGYAAGHRAASTRTAEVVQPRPAPSVIRLFERKP